MPLVLSSQPGFSSIDWGVIAIYIVLTTYVGAKLAGKQATIRDFFLGGRKLPWWAICGSTIATEVSTATFVAVPAMSFAAGGNLTYLQLAIGSIIARIIVGFYFVPRYYEHEIYSPYDYVGRELGPQVKTVTTALFMIGAVLGQGARLYVSAFVLSVIANVHLITAIWMLGAFSVIWAMLGGITTVIWTDVMQFCILVLGALTALFFSLHAVDAPFSEIVHSASAAGKFRLFDFSTDLALRYTFWCGLLATPFSNLAAFGTDQVMAQRMFCCKDARDARKAIICSSVSILVALVMLLVGVALFVYFQHHPLTGEEADRVKLHREFILPIFIVRALPVGVRGIIVAAIFAASIATLESALAALAQTSSAPLTKWLRRSHTDIAPKTGYFSGEVGLFKLLVAGWGVFLCIMGTLCIPMARSYDGAIDFVLALSAYTAGPLLGIFLLAFLRTNRDDGGLIWAVPISILSIFSMAVHVPIADFAVWSIAGLTVLLLIRFMRDRPQRLTIIACGMAFAVCLHYLRSPGADGHFKYPAFPWTYPVGTIVAFTLAYLLGRPRVSTTEIRAINQ